ncbi:MAG: DUF4249 family protein [Porphyromonadaceae bacterium]|nr:DUF4249 family protein [Porphyromonadaceae bacterium]
MKQYMLKLSTLLIAIVSMASCRSALDIPYENLKEQLTILFLGTTDRDQHTLKISQTNMGQYHRIKGVQVEMSIDGVKAELKPIEPTGTYQLSTQFRSGQRVQISANYKDKKATSEFVVPNPAQVLEVKHEDYTLQRETGSRQEYTLWKIKIKDTANEKNYYRISAEYTDIVECVDTGEEISPRGWTPLRLDGSADNVLSDGNPTAIGSEDDEDLFGLSSYSNIYNVFSDRLFDGQEVGISLSSERISLPMNFYYQGDEGYYIYLGNGKDILVKPKHRRIRFLVEAISEDVYKYLISLGVAHSSYDESPFTTPVQIYSNVKGGAGIFGANATQVIDFNIDIKAPKKKR